MYVCMREEGWRNREYGLQTHASMCGVVLNRASEARTFHRQVADIGYDI